MTFLSSFLIMSIDWDKGVIRLGKFTITMDKISAFGFKLFKLLLIIVSMYLIIKIGTIIIDKFVKKQSKMKISLDIKKANTIGTLLKSLLRYTAYFFGFTAMLNEIFGTISLTFASIGGVAIGFGAQNLVKDIINGFFIIFEDQFAVGDYVNIGDKGGVVESIGLRLTKLKDFNGDIHMIPNGSINEVTNHSRSDMRVLVEVDIAYEESVDRAIDVIDKACEEFKSNENIVERPKVVGVTSLKNSGVTIRITAKAKPMTQWECENSLRREIKRALDLAGIEIFYPRRKIINEIK